MASISHRAGELTSQSRLLLAGALLVAPILATLLGPSGPTKQAAAGEIGFIEQFALSADREQVLNQLIPGSQPYYYYRCLHLQNRQQFDEVETLLREWIKRYKVTSLVREIQHRQALLTYSKNPSATLQYLTKTLNLRFDHQRSSVSRRSQLPTRLSPTLIDRERLTQAALQNTPDLRVFEDVALPRLGQLQLNSGQLRDLLTRLGRPDVSNLVDLIAKDLSQRSSRGFGSLPVHNQLLLPQMEQLAKRVPGTLNQPAFVYSYLAKIRPSDDVDWTNNRQEEEAFLKRQYAFVRRLAPTHNSLKVHVLFHWLTLEEEAGVHNKQRFLEYIKLPRRASYVNPRFLALPENRNVLANLNESFKGATQFAPIRSDEPLVRRFLHHFFVDDTSYEAFSPYISEPYLKARFAEAKLVNGLGNAEQWYSMLNPSAVQQLKDRVDLDFAPANREHFSRDAPVSLDVHVKNVKTLIVKIYEINTWNYYREKRQEVNTNINLDGLVPNYERTLSYQEPPIRRVKRSFELAELKKPGLYVVDFIGGGKSSRAVIRKGHLRHLSRMTSAGHVLKVLDESNRVLKDASVWMGGKEYEADDDGTIALPYSTAGVTTPLVLRHGNQSSLDRFQHSREQYSLQVAFYVDREALLARRKAELVIRPELAVNGLQASLSLLEKPILTIVSRDIDGVVTTRQIDDVRLRHGEETRVEFLVPQRLQTISFQLRGKVQVLSTGKKQDLTASDSFTINAGDSTDKIETVHLARFSNGYLLEVLGRTGEVRGHRPVQLQLKHREFRRPVVTTLRSDDRGRIYLGELPDIVALTATPTGSGTARSWQIGDDHRVTVYNSVHAKAGDTIEIPFPGTGKVAPERVSLLELRGGTFVRDRLSAASLKNGVLVVKGLAAGDYDLLYRETNQRMRLRVSQGEVSESFVLGEARMLELRGGQAVQISAVEPANETIRIQLANAGKGTRVHVFATRYEPAFDVFDKLSAVRDAEPYLGRWPTLRSLYAAGRQLGDEYRYIIDRKYALKFPGNMLRRPEILLNPWAIRKTEANRQEARKGTDFDSRGGALSGRGGRAGGEKRQLASTGDVANLDFLGAAASIALNLRPDAQGKVVVPVTSLVGHQYLHIVAATDGETVYRSLALKELPFNFQDLRMANALDPDKHFTLQKQVSIIDTKQKFKVLDIAASRFEMYDDLSGVFTLFQALSSNSTLNEFAFILDWRTFDEKKKRELYSKYACHELHFFIYEKDRKFFDRVIRPYLANKKDRTFLDRWFLEEDLSTFRQPRAFSQLNVVERVLLGRRLPTGSASVTRHIKDLLDVRQPDPQRIDFLFESAVKGDALNVSNRTAAVQEKFKSKNAIIRASDSAPTEGSAGRRLARPMDAGAVRELSELKKAADKNVELAARKYVQDAKKSLGDRFAVDGTTRLRADLQQRGRVRALYQALDKTQEWAENNYYHLPIEKQNAALVGVNGFWNDYASHDPKKPFYSKHMSEAAGSFSEMIMALSVLDLPPKAAKHETVFAKAEMTVTAGSPFIAFHEQLRPAQPPSGPTPILVSQNFYRQGDRYRQVDNERVDKFVTDEFLVQTVYGCQIVVTNPTSSAQKIDVLLQIPNGGLPVAKGKYTRSQHLDLQPYHTQTIDYLFYFPAAGNYLHYPVHVAKGEQLLAFSDAIRFKVVERLSKVDRQSWAYISQEGTDADVLEYLETQNLQKVALEQIAFRMANAKFFDQVTETLAARHIYNHTLWSYSLKHNRPLAIAQYLEHADSFVTACGDYLESKLLTIKPVIRKTYQHLEYRPLVNARAHQLGQRRTILNERLHKQYESLLKVLGYRRQLDDTDYLALVYYMLVQDRVQEAKQLFQRVNPESVDSRLQYDCFAAYLDFYNDKPTRAREIVQRYADYPVDRWRNAFASVRQHLEALDKDQAVFDVVDKEDRDQRQAKLAATEPNFSFKVEAKKVDVQYQKLEQLQVNYYLMDIELLFSRKPFVQEYSSQFSHIRPNLSAQVKLPKDKGRHSFALPPQYHNRNVVVEISGGGKTLSTAYYANSLALQLVENYGHLRVTHAGTRRPLSKVYVKVYSQQQDGQIKFYKDGYTDLRGRFDYTSLNTNDLDRVQKFSVLVMSEDHGAIIREAAPPKR